jgi:hypothetical protein
MRIVTTTWLLLLAYSASTWDVEALPESVSLLTARYYLRASLVQHTHGLCGQRVKVVSNSHILPSLAL